MLNISEEMLNADRQRANNVSKFGSLSGAALLTYTDIAAHRPKRSLITKYYSVFQLAKFNETMSNISSFKLI